MAIALRSYGDAFSAGATSHPVTAPTGAASGDVLYGHWFTPAETTWTAPAGWATLISTSDPSWGSALVCRKVLSGAPDATYTATTADFGASWGTISAWTGADTTTPEDVAAASDQNASADAPGITTATNGAMLLCWWAEAPDEVGAAPGGMTQIEASGGAPSYVAAYGTIASAGATGTRTASGLTEKTTCVSVGIRPLVTATIVPNSAMLMGVGI